MTDDPYKDLAEHYDRLKFSNPDQDEFFRDVRPASIIVQVSRFIDPDWLVEIEADAVIDRNVT